MRTPGSSMRPPMLWLVLLQVGLAAAHTDVDVEAIVSRVLAGLSVPEKARQLDIFRGADMLSNGEINMTKAAELWGNLSYGVGVMHDVYPYPHISNQMMKALIDMSSSKIPPIIGAEATHGLQMDDHTIFPSPISLAATWDIDIMRAYGSVVGAEARAGGTHVTWAPVLGLCREPRWGRCEEMMGEDTHLAAELGRAAINGFTNNKNHSSDRAVAPLMKTYLAYSVPEGGHNTAPAHVGRRELLSTFVPPFAAGMEAGALAMMVSYNEIDGMPNAANEYLLSQIPRGGPEQRGSGPSEPFDGFVSSDFGAIRNLYSAHDVAETTADAIAQYITAGGSVQGFDFDHKTWHDGVVSSIADGSLTEAALDAAVRRVLRVKARLGLFDTPFVADTTAYHRLITSPKHEAIALEAARKAMVLLQNFPDVATGRTQPLLPLDATKINSIAVIGPNADQPQCGDYAAGGSWGADNCGGGPINNKHTSSTLGGIKALYPTLDVTYAPGAPIADFNESAPYYTTIQKHSYSTATGAQGIVGRYYKNQNLSGIPAITRNDFLLSFHFLNYGPGQSEVDPSVLSASAFSGSWEGFLTPDATANATFRVTCRGLGQVFRLWLDGELITPVVFDGAQSYNETNATVVSVTKGSHISVRFEYQQPDNTFQHPGLALQWSLQGADPVQDAIEAVKAADVSVVVVGGGTAVTSGEGIDRASLSLPGTQLSFLKRVRAAAVALKKPMVVVVVQGKPFGEQWMKQSLPAIIEAWQSGQAQGQVIAETIFGLNNPAGRIALSFAVSADHLPVYYNGKPTAKRGGYNNPPLIPGGLYPPTIPSSASVLWAFGHGLSYGAKFEYSGLSFDGGSNVSSTGMDGEVSVTFQVKNTGTVAAEEVVQLYVRDVLASVTTPVMQLRDFKRLPAIAAGSSRTVSLHIDVIKDFWLIDRSYTKRVEPGVFNIMIGGGSDKIQLIGSVTVVSEQDL